MTKHECHCGQLDLVQYPCPVHQPPLKAFAWEAVSPGIPMEQACLRRDQYGREVGYATRSGMWTSWHGAGVVGAPDVNLARQQADLDLYEHGLLLSIETWEGTR